MPKKIEWTEELLGLALALQGMEEKEAFCAEYGIAVSTLNKRLTKERKKLREEADEQFIKDGLSEKQKRLHYQSKLAMVRRERDVLLKQADTTEALVGAARDAIQALPLVKPPKPRIILPGEELSVVEIANLLLSDLHGGEEVSLIEMGGLNQYNMRVLALRLQHAADSVISIIQKMKGYEVSHLNINALGDMVTGVIHQELVEAGEETIIEWLFNTALLIAQMISDLLAVFDTIHFTGVIGNHGRLTKEKTFKRRYVNWDYILYQVVALMMMNNERVTFEIPRSFWTIREVGGRRQLLLHGDNIKSWAGIPWYGITRAVYKLQELLAANGVYFDDVILAHFHNQGMLQRTRGRLIINGSVVGGDEYSVGALFASSEPSQLLYFINPKKGRLTSSWDLELAEGDDKELRYVFNKDLVVADTVRNLFLA